MAEHARLIDCMSSPSHAMNALDGYMFMHVLTFVKNGSSAGLAFTVTLVVASTYPSNGTGGVLNTSATCCPSTRFKSTITPSPRCPLVL